MMVSSSEGRRIRLRGTVQGVGMRPWIYRLARQHGVTGRVCNEASGVTIDAFGAQAVLDGFVSALRRDVPPASAIDALDCTNIAPEAASGFVIVESHGGEERRVSIPPELATCDACVAEIFDPGNRRYGYPFTNCTNCGPRFTIATDVPYDRPATTMGAFAMCPDCQREYDDPGDRRFHAQPNACPACGPSLQVIEMPERSAHEGLTHTESYGLTHTGTCGSGLYALTAVETAAKHILAGRIVAVKGLGGFHLACDATSPEAVTRLRKRKNRDEKPFAVMVADIAAAEALAELSPQARALLTSVERPIVLVRRHLPAEAGSHASVSQDLPAEAGSHTDGDSGGFRLQPEGLCDEVAPRNPLIGLMLPYTPLHHLLLRACGRPLVMTSANLAEEPIVYRNDEAVRRLQGIADLLVVHDREIVTRCDDSVAAIVAGRPMLMRRSRGFVPRAVKLPLTVDTPVLATGALLKNTFCLAYGREAWLGPHIGDLENVETFAAFEEAIDRMERFLGFTGEVVAHDLHPEYLSTIYAHRRAGTSAVAVQHHYAHVASAMAEHGLTGPVLGLAFDGTGYGPDGTAWGGEFLVATPVCYDRVATFRPLPLPGGDVAIRHPWRIALALLRDAYGDEAPIDRLKLFRPIPVGDLQVVGQMLRSRLNAPLARGVGRYFDGFAALILARGTSRYEGQLALELNLAADPGECSRYEFATTSVDGRMEIDMRPAVRDAVADILRDAHPAMVSARFHNTLVEASAAVVRAVLREHGALPVVLTGGCFQNARLAEGIVAALPDVDVRLHERVPPGDGGIALGQALAAADGRGRL